MRPNLAVHLDDDLDLPRSGDALVEARPPAFEDRAIVPEDGPELLREMGYVRRQDHDEGLYRIPRRASRLPQGIHILHHRSDRRVVVQARRVRRDLPDRLMELPRNGRRPPRARW